MEASRGVWRTYHDTLSASCRVERSEALAIHSTKLAERALAVGRCGRFLSARGLATATQPCSRRPIGYDLQVMDSSPAILVAAAIALVAFLYSAVGHGGASGYLAIMALAGFAPDVMKPTALALNLVTSSVAAFLFFRAGHFSLRLFLPLAGFSVPFAFLGGRWTAPAPVFHSLVSLCLLSAAAGLIVRRTVCEKETTPSLPMIALAGGCIGFLSGLIGVGGGIFLTPLMLFTGWCRPKTASAVSALFIFVNSAAGLIGKPDSIVKIPPEFPWFLASVLAFGTAGSAWGSGLASNLHLRRALAAVLVIAAVKMIVTI